MLVELTVNNLAVIQQTRLDLSPGLNVVTGETGAGKSLLVDALEFVLGGAADRSLVRAGADGASVEAAFSITSPTPALRDALDATGVDLGDDHTLALFRETHREGRTVSRVNGRTVPVSVVRDIGAALVDIHGQGTHLSLLNPRFQLTMLDAYAGSGSQRDTVATAIADLRALETELADLTSGDRLAEQQRDLLRFQVSEITDAGLTPGEEVGLTRERDELANARMIQEACAAAYEALYGDSANASDLIAQAIAALRHSVDPSGVLSPHVEAFEESAARLADAAREIRTYAEGIASDPARLQEIEDRIETVRRLKRKYGDTEDSVLAFATAAQVKLDAYDHTDERRNEVAGQIAGMRATAGALAWELSRTRHDAADRLGIGVADQLADLAMANVRFAASVVATPDPDGLAGADGIAYGFSPAGIDAVEFLVETNPGEGLKTLARIASGGETARLMLALISALRGEASVPTLVFDEIDAGIGARASEVVGKKLWALGGTAQVLCVTHLPQIAAYADKHFRVAKAVENDRTFAGAHPLDGPARVVELAQMLGGERNDDLDAAARRILAAAEATKAGR
jgi:DNA repair protein RecN (Recombination protein N)